MAYFSEGYNLRDTGESTMPTAQENLLRTACFFQPQLNQHGNGELLCKSRSSRSTSSLQRPYNPPNIHRSEKENHFPPSASEANQMTQGRQMFDLTVKLLPSSINIDDEGYPERGRYNGSESITSLHEELMALETPNLSRRNSKAVHIDEIPSNLKSSGSDFSALTANTLDSTSSNAFRIRSQSKNQMKVVKFNKIKAITPFNFDSPGSRSDTNNPKLTMSTPKRKPASFHDFFGSTPLTPVNGITETPEKNSERKNLQTAQILSGGKMKLTLDRVETLPSDIRPPMSVRGLVRCYSILSPIEDGLGLGLRKENQTARKNHRFTFDGEGSLPQPPPTKPQIRAIKVTKRGSSSSRQPIRVFSMPEQPIQTEETSTPTMDLSFGMAKEECQTTGKNGLVEKGKYINNVIGEMLDTASPNCQPQELSDFWKVKRWKSDPEQSIPKKNNTMRFRTQGNILNKIFKD